jgi:N-acetylmuramoyl-L-alanine amidase
MNNNKLKKNKVKKVRRITLVFVLITISVIAFLLIFNKDKNNTIISTQYDALAEIDSDRYRVEEYYIYGTHLTIKGVLPLNNVTNVNNVTLVLVNKDEKSSNIELETEYEINDSNILFNTIGLINDSVYLDNLAIGNYYLLLKLETNATHYYSGLNNTDYKELLYYTLTKNNINNKIEISFGNEDEVPFMEFNIKESKLPDNVYDIVIDPGHGGIDPGNTSQSVPEKTQVLEISKKIKADLEAEGYKVLLTRDSDINPGNISFKEPDGTFNKTDPYGDGGRVAMSYESKAKYTFSIHTNAHPQAKAYYGLEIYTPGEINYDLVESLVDNIKELSGVDYSTNWYYRKGSGIYTRYLSSDDLNNMKAEASELGYSMYPATNKTLYNYMIRETGGYMMGAYIDGRDTTRGANSYRNSNYGTETYLVEFAYASSEIDYPKIVSNKDGMAEGLTIGFVNYTNSK